jgi:hypothetical protein
MEERPKCKSLKHRDKSMTLGLGHGFLDKTPIATTTMRTLDFIKGHQKRK